MLCYISDSGFQYGLCLLVHVFSVYKSDICKCDVSFSVPLYFSVRRRNVELSLFLPDKPGSHRHVYKFVLRTYGNMCRSKSAQHSRDNTLPSLAGTKFAKSISTKETIIVNFPKESNPYLPYIKRCNFSFISIVLLCKYHTRRQKKVNKLQIKKL